MFFKVLFVYIYICKYMTRMGLSSVSAHSWLNRFYFLLLRAYGYFFAFLNIAKGSVSWLFIIRRFLFFKAPFSRRFFRFNNLVYIKFKVTLNNYFLVAHCGSQMIQLSTCGIAGFSGPARKSFYTIEVATRHFVNALASKGVISGYLYIKGKVNKYFLKTLRLMRRMGFRFEGVLFLPLVCHNGPRASKMKRR